MKKKWLSTLLVGSLCLALGLPGTAYADGQKVVTLGADLTQDQKNAVLKYFGVLGQNIETLTITNQDERNHLGSYVPMEQIGTRTFSCALVCPTTSGGIQVKTANLSWVTSNMIASTLSTSGVVNCDVLAASPFEVSGTGALTGIIMAYESASGTTLDPVKKELATQELITTGTIANEIGQQQATNIVNEIKIQVIEGAVVEPEEVEEIVEEVVEANPEVSLSDEDRALLTGLMTQIAEQQYDYEEMKDTLQRVEENVSGLSEKVDELQNTDNTTVEVPEQEELDQETLPSDSILLNTDDSALGEDVIIDATNEEAVPEENQEAAEAADDFGFDITTTDSYGEDGTNETPEVALPENEGDGQDTTLPENEGDGQDTTIPENDEYTGVDLTEAATEGTIDGAEDPAQLPALELGSFRVLPDTTNGSAAYAGTSLISLLYENDHLVPVSGTLTVSDEWGNVYSEIDLDDDEQVTEQAVSEEMKLSYGWNGGTEIVIHLDKELEPNQNYTVALEGVLAQAEDPLNTENAPKASVDETWNVPTYSYGIRMNIEKLTDVREGAILSGEIIMNDEMVYAEINGYDDTELAFDATEYYPESAALQVTCLKSGKNKFNVDYYDADGNYVASALYELTVQ